MLVEGVMFLDEDLSGDSRLGVVTLNRAGLSTNEPLQVIGYGAEKEDGDATDTLEYTNVNYVTSSECQSRLNAYNAANKEDGETQSTEAVDSSMICAQGKCLSSWMILSF